MVNNIIEVDSTSGKRKINKPLIEKKRRARINNCLSQLKTLVLEATGRNNESAFNSKLEKADILEMTVQYLENIHKSSTSNRSNITSTITTPYQMGYTVCTGQAARFLEINSRVQADKQIDMNVNNKTDACRTVETRNPDVPSSHNQNNFCQAKEPSSYNECNINNRLVSHLSNNIQYHVNKNRDSFTSSVGYKCSSSNSLLCVKTEEPSTERRLTHNNETQNLIVTVRGRDSPTTNRHNSPNSLSIPINDNVWRPW
ncbi:transcription factor HES-5-like [Mytilus trossulus]|uniref:transcription factor HES-5-like n=1 Tax=Mytilus trossulus TaxID=6551 RepID=UPI003004B94A